MSPILDDRTVAVTGCESPYPDAESNPTFDPSTHYPEYPHSGLADQENRVYEAVRRSLRLLGYDSENFGTATWNPLGEIVSPGDKVVLKPNFVRHYHRLGHPLDCVITHASVLRPIMDYVWIALRGRGEIIVADAPQGDASFEELIRANGTRGLFDWYERQGDDQLKIELRDIRKEWTPYKHGVIWDRIKLKGDPEGYHTIALDDDSEFYAVAEDRDYYGADPDRARTKKFHHGTINRYNVAGTILNADVLISVPKLKVHRKVGVTLNIKNLIGINGEKNFLPHFTVGSPEEGGDEFSNDTFNNKIDRKLKDFLLWKNPSWGKYAYLGWHALDKFILRKFQAEQSFVKGDWHGNDTTWRAAVDLAKIILYADKQGQMHDVPQRRYFSFVDGVVGGDREGPLTPHPQYSNLIIAGQNPLVVDLACTGIMGLDWRKFRMLSGARKLSKYPLTGDPAATIELRTDLEEELTKPIRSFTPPAGWIGHVEWDDTTPPIGRTVRPLDSAAG